MTRAEALRVMAVLAAGKPAGGPDADATRLVWLPKLAGLDLGMAMSVAQALIDQPGHFFPVWGDFLAAYRQEAARQRMTTPALPEDTSGPATTETARRCLGEIREALRHAKGPLAISLRSTVARVSYPVEHEQLDDETTAESEPEAAAGAEGAEMPQE